MPPLNPDVADFAPSNPALTAYDDEHIITYVRLLDADAAGADWREVARIVLHIDPKREPIPRRCLLLLQCNLLHRGPPRDFARSAVDR
jgi:hypothetical protein